MLLLVTAGFVVLIVAMSVGLAIVQFRKVTPLVFACTKCGATFHQAPHRDTPKRCPTCKASAPTV